MIMLMDDAITVFKVDGSLQLVTNPSHNLRCPKQVKILSKFQPQRFNCLETVHKLYQWPIEGGFFLLRFEEDKHLLLNTCLTPFGLSKE